MTQEKNTEICVVDECKKYKKSEDDFWDIFTNLDDSNFFGSYNLLPDPDSRSEKLYKRHCELWNKRCNSNQFKNIPLVKITDEGSAYTLTNKEHNLRLGSDSIISIYWHWNSMQDIIKEDNNWLRKTFKDFNISEADKEERKFNNNWSDLKKFVWGYLQKANTIGGFVVFPKHPNSINGRRGLSAKIRDRFDLTLECIRRGYERGFEDNDPNNPLADVLEGDKEFFAMFGSFKNYVDFFCLNSWVNDNYDNYEVKDLLSDDGNSLLPKDKWPQKILPCDFDGDERVKWWWNLYNNLMNHLDARNTDIQKLFWDKNK